MEAFPIGAVGSLLAIVTVRLMDKLHIDDPVGAIAVHGAPGAWVGTRPCSSYPLKVSRHVGCIFVTSRI